MSTMNKKIAVSTRFHSWAENDFISCLDLNELIIKHRAATFFVRVKGDGMITEGICSGDILVVDRAIALSNHKIIIARLDGQLVVRRIMLTGKGLLLISDNHEPLAVSAERDFEVWGIVIAIIRQT
jgi:DNA polymerase V